MPFPSPPPPCIIYPPGIALGPSIQFLLMKHPSHFDLVRDLWLCYFTVHFCVFCFFFFFKLDFTAGGRTFSFLSAPSETAIMEKEANHVTAPVTV